jgi:hypothetical protein
MTKPQGFLATFRIDEELWGKFKDIAKNKQTNASALILQYIQGVVSSGGVDNPPKATPPNIDISPQPNLDSIYKYIDNKLDNLEDVSIQDIDNKIAESLEDGDIKDAIAASYAGMMAQFNGLLEEWQELKKQFEELKSIPQPQINEELTIDNEEPTTDNGQFSEDVESDSTDSENKSDTQSPITDEEQAEKNRQSHEEYVQKYLTPKPEKQRLDPAIYTRNYQIVSMLGCQFWMDGKKFNNQDLKENEIDKNIATNKVEIESILGIDIILKDKVIHRFVKILRAMKFEIKGNQTDGYYIANPEIFN